MHTCGLAMKSPIWFTHRLAGRVQLEAFSQ